MGNLYQATAQALANAAHNATNAQQQSYVTSQSATTMGVATLYSLDTASTGVATKTILTPSSGVRGLGTWSPLIAFFRLSLSASVQHTDGAVFQTFLI